MTTKQTSKFETTIEAAAALEPLKGQRITLWQMGDFGFPQSCKATLKDVRLEKYAQYDQSLLLIMVKKGCRTPFGVRYTYKPTFMIWKDWIEVDSSMFGKAEDAGNGVSIQRAHGKCFPPVFRERAEQSTDQAPIAAMY